MQLKVLNQYFDKKSMQNEYITFKINKLYLLEKRLGSIFCSNIE